MTKFAISIASSSRGPQQHPHWAFHIASEGTHTHFYQLGGVPPSLYHDHRKSILGRPESYLGIYTIGEIDAGEVEAFEEVVNGVEARQDVGLDQNTEWGDIRGCRAWCLDCIVLLKAKGWVYGAVTESSIIKYLFVKTGNTTP